jgi:hypothetical protein
MVFGNILEWCLTSSIQNFSEFPRQEIRLATSNDKHTQLYEKFCNTCAHMEDNQTSRDSVDTRRHFPTYVILGSG